MTTADVTTSYLPECVPCSWAGKRTVDEEFATVQALQHDRDAGHEITTLDLERIRAWAFAPVVHQCDPPYHRPDCYGTNCDDPETRDRCTPF